MKALVVVDVQNDFVTGALGTKEARDMLPDLVETVNGFDGEIRFTQDTHKEDYLDTQEGKFLPVKHCAEGSDGWRLIPELEIFAQKNNCKIYCKPCFGSAELADDLKNLYETGVLEEVRLVGLCTDICVVSNALLIKAAAPELAVSVDAKCCAGVTPEKHAAALEVMKSCQVIVVNG